MQHQAWLINLNRKLGCSQVSEGIDLSDQKKENRVEPLGNHDRHLRVCMLSTAQGYIKQVIVTHHQMNLLVYLHMQI